LGVHQGSKTRPDSNDHVRLVGYCRISGKGSNDEGLSIRAQERKIRSYCKLHEQKLVTVESDTARSGGRIDRPGLQRVLSALTAGDADGIIVVKLDRLTRSTVDLGTLVADYFAPDKPYRLVSVTDNIDTVTAGGRLVANVLMAVAQWEREAASERTSAVKEYKRQRGEFLGGEPPYGYRVEGKMLVPDEEEREVMSTAKDMRTRWGYSLQDIADAFNDDGVPRRRGRSWTRQAIARLLG
jgi:DNA invertase Pin-like site-specific DNA recombinase